MNTMIKTLSLAVVGSLITVAGAQAAGFAGASSDTNHIIIQPTGSNGPHGTVGGDVGIRVKSATGVFGQLTMGLPAYKQYTQKRTVQGYKVHTLNANILPPNHRSLGNFDFTQVPDQEVYFGEWTANRSSPYSTHTVYYGGKNKADRLPSRGSVLYQVKGINNFNNKLLSGLLTANFSNNSLTGNFRSDKNTRYKDIKIDAKINPSNASFEGSATYKGGFATLPIRLNGETSGHFFGNNGESLAGIATFGSNKHYNTAFGGKKISLYDWIKSQPIRKADHIATLPVNELTPYYK